jgi:hypothetical protein
MDRSSENRAIARREIEDFEGKGRVSLAPELFAADYQLTFSGMPAIDRAGHELLIGGFREAFADLQIRVSEQVAADDRVGNHWGCAGHAPRSLPGHSRDREGGDHHRQQRHAHR